MSSEVISPTPIASHSKSPYSTETTKRLEDRIVRALQPFRTRAHLISIGLAVISSVISALLWMVAVMWSDLIFDFGGTLRLWLARITLPVCATTFVLVYVQTLGRGKARELSRRVDDNCGTHGLVEGSLNIATKNFSHSAISSALAFMAVDQSVSEIRNALPSKVISQGTLNRLVLLLGLFVVGATLFCLASPRLAWTQTNRFLFPLIDIPRYTLMTIELDPEEIEVVFGEDCTVAAIAAGELTESMQLVVIRDDKSEEAIPMLSEGDGRFSVTLSRLRAPLNYYAKAKSTKSKTGRLTIKTTPEIRSVTKLVRYPAYTGVAEKQSPLDQEGIKALINSEVTIHVSSNRPLKRGVLTLMDKNGKKREVFLPPVTNSEDATAVESAISVETSGAFELRVEDIDGTLSHDVISGPIEVMLDQPPNARIVQPRPDSLATPDAALPVVIVSEDDFGITSIELYRSLNDSRPVAESLTADGTPRAQSELALPLSQYSLQPGDVIKLFARVEDNKPDSPQGFETPITTVKIISREEFQQRIVQQQGMDEMLNRYRQIQRHLETAANAAREAQEAQDELAKNPSDPDLQKRAQEKLQAAADAAEQAAQQINKIAEQPLNMELDQNLSQAMKEVAKQLAQNAADLDFLAKESSKQKGELAEGQKEDLERIASEMNASKNDVKNNVNEPLERMKQTLPLMMAQRAFEELVQQQTDLAMRMESLKESSDPNDQVSQRRLKALESQQQALRDQLSDLVNQIEEEANKLPPDPELESLRSTALDFARSVKESEALTEMQNAQNDLLENRPEPAAVSAAKAAEILSSFLQSNESMGNRACENCQQKFAPGMNNAESVKDAMNQLMQMMGMKPGQTGRGSGYGFGASGIGGFGGSERNAGTSNRGMYGSLPMSRPSSGGRGQTGGPTLPNDFVANPLEAQSENGKASGRKGVTSDGANAIPSQYRNSVYQYFQNIADDN